MSIVFAAVGAVALAYALVVGLLWWRQEGLVYRPPSSTPEPTTARTVRYRSADGTELYAYVVGKGSASGPIVLAFHGNADLARWYVPWAGEVSRRTGAIVVVPEFRGYGGVAGPPTFSAIGADASAAYEMVVAEWPDALERLAIFGHSLGSAVATELALQHAPRVLILQSPFTSMRAMGERLPLYGVMAVWPLIARVRYDTRDIVRRLKVPVWVAHGTIDSVIPVQMGRDVFADAAIKGELLVVAGADHSDVAEVGDEPYWSWLGRAIAVAGAADSL